MGRGGRGFARGCCRRSWSRGLGSRGGLGLAASRPRHLAILLRPPWRGEERRSGAGKSGAVLLVRRPPPYKQAVCAPPPPSPPGLGGTLPLLSRASCWRPCLSPLLPALSDLSRDMRLPDTFGCALLERAPHPLLPALPGDGEDGRGYPYPYSYPYLILRWGRSLSLSLSLSLSRWGRCGPILMRRKRGWLAPAYFVEKG